MKEVALEPGYFAISQEVLGDYAGDYVILVCLWTKILHLQKLHGLKI